jgi:hypothetical protein
MGNPYAIVHPSLFFEGSMVLLRQYSSSVTPLGLHDSDLLGRVGYAIRYLLYTVGPLVMTGVVVSLLRCGWSERLLLGLTVFSTLYLGSRSVFFERNFDHCLPILFLYGWIGIELILRQVAFGKIVVFFLLFLIGIAPTTYYGMILQSQILSGSYNRKYTSYLNQQNSQSGGNWVVWPNMVYGDPVPALKRHIAGKPLPFTIVFSYPGDRYSKKAIREFLSEYEFVKVSELKSPLIHIPPSTMQEYMARSLVTFRLERQH